MSDNPGGQDSRKKKAGAGGRNYTPVLGLFAEGEPRPAQLAPRSASGPVSNPASNADSGQAPAAATSAGPLPEASLELSVLVPARDEEHNLRACLQSLVGQHEPVFSLGTDWELLVIDDHSSDGTRAIAEEFAAQYAAQRETPNEVTPAAEQAARPAGIRVLAAPPLESEAETRAFTGKNNACWAGAGQARGRWLLFTDADTRHEPGDLRRALHEADRNHVALLSYSPRQILHGVAQRLLMPLVFSELASVYPPARVNDPEDRVAAANGQFLLIERATYFAVGGHRAVGRSVLEDVELAHRVKRAGKGIRLRYAPDALSTAMYRGFADMAAGWTKNLALLFPHAFRLALWRVLDFLLLLLPLLLWLLPYLVLWQRVAILALWARTLVRFYQRIARAHFPFVSSLLAPLGLPLFAALLLRSWFGHRVLHQVTWKGRRYRG